MPVLIDGYNLYHYVRSLYQESEVELSLPTFCRLLDEWTVRAKQKTRIIFDGSSPPVLRQNRDRFGNVEVEFTGSKTDADTVIEAYIAQNTAPRLLTIVSSDLRIRRMAARRQCKLFKSDEFWKKIARKLVQKGPKPEPREKSAGLVSDEREYWLKVFGMK